MKGRICAMELNFKKELSSSMMEELKRVELILAADGMNEILTINIFMLTIIYNSY